MSKLGRLLMRSILRSLEVPNEIRQDIDTQFDDPLTLFRIFHYPPHSDVFGKNSTAVGKHSDYGKRFISLFTLSLILTPTSNLIFLWCLICRGTGYLTLLLQDDSGGLEAQELLSGGDTWIQVLSSCSLFVAFLSFLSFLSFFLSFFPKEHGD